MVNTITELADWNAEVFAVRMFHVSAIDENGEYICGGEFSCNLPSEAEELFMEDASKELYGDYTIGIEHVGYTVYDFDDDYIDIHI